MSNSKPSSRSARLITRDINESLGKLPPQALDLEEGVIGAILLEKNAITAVIDFLKPEHFYLEAHLIIYQAVIDMHRAGNAIDMRTVVAHLSRIGKLELVDGAYKIAELTSKVATAANIEYHARIVVEMAMKRHLIEIASNIHYKAYEPHSDVFNILDDTEKIIKGIHDNSIVESDEQKVKKMWAERQIVEEPSEPPPLLKIGDTPILIAGNHSLIVGKKKARKTLFIVQLLSEFIKFNPQDANKVLLFDTEQGKGHVYKIRKKIHKITGKFIPVFFLRGLTHVDRVKFITNTIKLWPDDPKIVVIDGIRDLMADINNSDESNDLIYWLEKTTLENNLAVLNILHLNKTDKNPRGHIGTELTNKALATIELSLDEKSGHTIVKCESSRERGFEDFAFTHDGPGSDALPMIVGMPVAGNSIPVEERITRIKSVFEDSDTLTYKDLCDGVGAHFGVGLNKSKQLIAEFTRKNWIMKNGKEGKNSIYKILAPRDNGSGPEFIAPSPIESPPPGLFDNAMTLQDQVGDEDEPALDNGNPDDLPF